jgi:hypothetical protein
MTWCNARQCVLGGTEELEDDMYLSERGCFFTRA